MLPRAVGDEGGITGNLLGTGCTSKVGIDLGGRGCGGNSNGPDVASVGGEVDFGSEAFGGLGGRVDIWFDIVFCDVGGRIDACDDSGFGGVDGSSMSLLSLG